MDRSKHGLVIVTDVTSLLQHTVGKSVGTIGLDDEGGMTTLSFLDNFF